LVWRVTELSARRGEGARILRRVISESAGLVAARAPDLGPVKADPAQMEQVIVNLAVNARDAMPRGGRLTIETANVAAEEMARAHPTVRPGAYVMLAVADTGAGMDAEARARVFEPFFKPKARGAEGVGL